ncbi:MAG: Lrp/AsnC ligand binding domain-containing protein, partial [Promethearchaeati archaeon]
DASAILPYGQLTILYLLMGDLLAEKVKPQTGDIIELLWAINGVESVSALAGKHDYLLAVRTRNLGKTRTKILKRVQSIPGIQDTETLVVFKEFTRQ